jgi:putative membrane protein
MSARYIVATTAIATLPRVALAHTGRAPEPHDLWRAWTIAPVVIASLAIGAWLYARGARALWWAAGRGRVVARWRAACFAGGAFVVALALLSPIDAVGSALFSVHMTQHMLLVVVAAPLLMLGDPPTAMLWAFPVGARRRIGLAWREWRVGRVIWHQLRHPLVAWTLHVGVLWLWHLPTLYDAALRDERVHVLEHGTFFLTALLFWSVLTERRPRYRLSVGAATLYLFAAALQCTLLGALMAFAHRAWYFAHYGTTAAWGLTPLEDQQIAGLIMWIPAGMAYVVALIPTMLPALRAPAQWVASPTVAGVSARGTP